MVLKMVEVTPLLLAAVFLIKFLMPLSPSPSDSHTSSHTDISFTLTDTGATALPKMHTDLIENSAVRTGILAVNTDTHNTITDTHQTTTNSHQTTTDIPHFLAHCDINSPCRRMLAMVQKTICDIVKDVYGSAVMNTASGKMPVADYCSQAGIHPSFDGTHNSLLHCNLMELKEFDFSFGYIVLTQVCSQVYNKLSETCKADINRLRTLVNVVIPQEMMSDGTDVEGYIQDLKIIQESIYKEVGDLLSKEMSDSRQPEGKTFGAVTETDTSDLGDKGDNSSEEDIIKSITTEKGVSELLHYHEQLWDLKPCTWIDETECFYQVFGTNHFPVQMVFAQPKITRNKRVITLRNLLISTKTRGDMESIPTALLIHGLAGSGKTSLCRYIIYCWHKGVLQVNGLNDFDLVFLIEIRRVRSSLLKEFLSDQLLPKTTLKTQDKLISMLKELNILFLIDGYDETNRMSCDLVEDIFAKFGDKRIILTSRPEMHHDALCVSRRHQVQYLSLELCGFEGKSKDHVSQQMFRLLEQDDMSYNRQTQDFLNYLHDSRRVLDRYSEFPLVIACLILLWKYDSQVVNSSTTATQLYQKLYQLLMKNLAERLSKDFIGVIELPDILNDLLLFLGEQAWTVLREGSIIASDFVQEKIEKQCCDKKVKVIELLSGFHMCHLNENLDEWKIKVGFFHSHQACYLAATFLAQCLEQKIMKIQDIGRDTQNCQGLEQVLMFLTGHLALQNKLSNAVVNEIFSVMKKIEVEDTDFNFWWRMFVESKQHPQVATILAREKLPQRQWLLDDTNVVSGLRLLNLTPVKLMNLTINIPRNVEPHDIPNFLQELEGVEFHLKKRQKKAIRVELFLWHHEGSQDRISDDFLKALGSWGDLTSFVGSLGDQPKCHKFLQTCSNLRALRVSVATPQALKSLSTVLRKIYKGVKSLQVTLALPRDCSPETVCEVKHSGNLEIILKAVKDTQKEWLVEVVKTIGGRAGCWRLSLEETDLSYDSVAWLVTQLKGRVHHKIAIESIS